MRENGIYFGDEGFYQLIRSIGGTWNDSKERPILCLMKSVENSDIYWAIPMENWEHRDEKAKERIQKYLELDSKDIRSCFYHIGKTDVNSIFFISDAVPITEKYISREYTGKYTGELYIIKNSKLLEELQRKLKRILAWESANKNSFRQHITDIKEYLIHELSSEKNNSI